ncbi:MAG TPA: zf-TFIIB domain-containing protein [Candidatus Limnocylindria bacterium]|nr:zf-TFIIB domain-containing protein [Candidatus Limnocylindria bacterium]
MTTESMSAATALRCPKCDAPMRMYERNGVHVDRCTECGGIFLDRGELDRLITAESAYYGPADDRISDDRARYRRDDRRRSDDRDDHGPGGFLGNLFDLG